MINGGWRRVMNVVVDRGRAAAQWFCVSCCSLVENDLYLYLKSVFEIGRGCICLCINQNYSLVGRDEVEETNYRYVQIP